MNWFTSLELKTGSLESEKIIDGAQNTSNFIKFSQKIFRSLQVDTGYLV